MTNEEFFAKCKGILKERGWSVYELAKHTRDEVIKNGTLYAMFKKESTARIEYISEISRALDMELAEMVDPENYHKDLTPIQIEILREFEGCSEDQIRRALSIAKGIILASNTK